MVIAVVNQTEFPNPVCNRTSNWTSWWCFLCCGYASYGFSVGIWALDVGLSQVSSLFSLLTDNNTSAACLDSLLAIGRDDNVHTSIYDNATISISISNFSLLSSNIPSSKAYDVFISQLIRYAGPIPHITVGFRAWRLLCICLLMRQDC